jgi:GAF domain-containing protein
MTDAQSIILDKERLKVLRDLALIDGPFETIYDRFTQLASKAVGAPVSLVSMVGGDYQFFKSYVGLPEPWASQRNTPLSHSICRHVVVNDEPLIVTDTREVDFLKDNGAIPTLNMIGYLGMPIHLKDGRSLGSFCVIDGKPREWTQTEIEIVRELAEIVTNEIELKAKVNIDPTMQAHLDEMHSTIFKLLDSLDTAQPKEDFLKSLKAAREQYAV